MSASWSMGNPFFVASTALAVLVLGRGRAQTGAVHAVMPSDLKKTAYSHLLPQHHDSPSSSSPASSRSSSPAPLPADDKHFAFSTTLRRHEPESVVDFSHPLSDLKQHVAARFTAYEPVGGQGGSAGGQTGPAAYPTAAHGHAGPGGYSHHPFAHTTSPLTPSAHFASQSIAQTLSALSASASSGLDAGKVQAIRELSGPNEFEVEAKDPTWKKFLGKFYEDPLILLLMASAAVSVVVGNYDDAASILVAVFIVVTGDFSLLLERATRLLMCLALAQSASSKNSGQKSRSRR